MLFRRLWLLLWLAFGALLQQASGQQTTPLSILHSNDLHAQLLPTGADEGGFARLATAVQHEKANCAACIYLNAGDLVQGSPVSTIYEGLPIYRIANLLGLDAATLGNHDFDYGWRRTRQFARIARYPVVSANVVNEAGESITGKPNVILKAGNLRVGIIGVVLSNLVTAAYVSAKDVEPWRVLPVLDTVRKQVLELRPQTDLLIVLGHIDDAREVDAILRDIPEVSVVVAGHNHVAYPQMHKVDGRVAVLTDSFGTALGRLDLQVDAAAKKAVSANWRKIPIDKSIPEAPRVAGAVAKWEKKVARIVDVEIGQATQLIDKPAQVKLFEQALVEETQADLVYVDPGSLRDQHNIAPGKIMARQIWAILPYDNVMVSGKFKGRELPEVVKQGKNIDPEREYTLAVSDFTATNQASPRQLNKSGLAFPAVGRRQRDLIIEWIERKKVLP